MITMLLLYMVCAVYIIRLSIHETKKTFFRSYENRNRTEFTLRDYFADSDVELHLFAAFVPLFNMLAALILLASAGLDWVKKRKWVARLANMKL